MQQVYLFMDTGDGFRLLNDHTATVAALEGLTVRWGTDSPDTQPDPSVLTFTLRDRTGLLAGRAATMAGARVLVQISEQPTWADMPAGTYAAATATWAGLHATYTPGDPTGVDSTAITLFDGIVSTGGTVTPDARGYLLELSASSRMILWKRLQSQGPTNSAAKWAGLHWVDIPVTRLATLNSRATAAGAPQADAAGLTRPPNVAPYPTDDYPSQLDLLHRMYATAPEMPLWGEYPSKASSRISYTALGTPATLGMDAAGSLYTTVNGVKRPALDGSVVEGGESYDVPEPVTQITFGVKTVEKDNDGVLSFKDGETTFTSMDSLPANLTATQSSMNVDTDVVTSDSTAGTWGGTIWTPSLSQRISAANWLYAVNMRIRPQGIVFDSRRIDPVNRPELYVSAPSGPIVFTNASIHRLAGGDGLPAFTGAWTTIGGTLTYRWRNGDPVLRHEVTVWPLPAATMTTRLKWADIAGWPAQYRAVACTWAELAVISTFDSATTTTETESEEQ
ncbi:hypothetical protein [Bifidobacterium callitrichidarum]|uniref:Uncharacterized protein n=1 Tax=Bifidobacterium callitrichidarum TaxID=2052941 RepID=A0A2U2N7G2_9BIFI|nr:hypothetical protein [Bifidobacterium callitrichidarum]PWG65038.1 hypothetical protein DF196_07800 [Bifidobacterium callitrichidarum]